MREGIPRPRQRRKNCLLEWKVSKRLTEFSDIVYVLYIPYFLFELANLEIFCISWFDGFVFYFYIVYH